MFSVGPLKRVENCCVCHTHESFTGSHHSPCFIVSLPAGINVVTLWQKSFLANSSLVNSSPSHSDCLLVGGTNTQVKSDSFLRK